MTAARSWVGVACAALVAVASGNAGAAAPRADAPVRYDADADALLIARAGLPLQPHLPLPARRQQAKRAARERAQRGLTEFVDGELSRRAAPPWVAAAVHSALNPKVVSERQLADGSAVVRMSAPAAPLRAAWDRKGLPWRR